MYKWLLVGLALIALLYFMKRKNTDLATATPDQSREFKPPFENIEENPIRIDPVSGEATYEPVYRPLPYYGDYQYLSEKLLNG